MIRFTGNWEFFTIVVSLDTKDQKQSKIKSSFWTINFLQRLDFKNLFSFKCTHFLRKWKHISEGRAKHSESRINTRENNRLGTIPREQNRMLIKEYSLPLEEETLYLRSARFQNRYWEAFSKVSHSSPFWKNSSSFYGYPAFVYIYRVDACLFACFGFEILRSRVAVIAKPHLHPDLMKMSRSGNSGMTEPMPMFSRQRPPRYTFNRTGWIYQLTALRENEHYGKPWGISVRGY